MSESLDVLFIRAKEYRKHLDDAIKKNDAQNIIYYRGNYIEVLKRIHAINPSILLSSSIVGHDQSGSLSRELSLQMLEHKNFINNQRLHAKESNHSLISNIKLKTKKTFTKLSKIKHAAPFRIIKDSIGVVTKIVKVPVMISAKVLSFVGPLAIKVMAVPFMLIEGTIQSVLDVSDEKKEMNVNVYTDTVVWKMSDLLKDTVKTLCDKTYDTFKKL